MKLSRSEAEPPHFRWVGRSRGEREAYDSTSHPGRVRKDRPTRLRSHTGNSLVPDMDSTGN